MEMKKDQRTNTLEQNKIVQDARQIKRITWIGLAVNFLLSALKFFVGFLGTRQAVIADAVHSLSDMSTDFAAIFGVKFANFAEKS